MANKLDDVAAKALAGNPDDPAMDYKGEIIPWSYLQRVAEQLDTLLTDAGLNACTPIGFVPRNRPAFCGALLSLLAARRSIVMIYAFQSADALAADIKQLALPAVIADAQDWNAATLAAIAPGARAIALPSDVHSHDPVRLIAGDFKADRSTLRPATPQPVVELLTSGTTGAPKRSPMLYQTIENGVISGSILDGKDGDNGGGEPGTVNFPLSNVSGIYSYLPMAVARRLVLLLEKFDLKLWLAFIQRHKPKVVILPPAGVRMMLDADLPGDALAGVDYVSAGTTAIDPSVHRAFEKKFGVAILLSYGATEFCGAATAMTADLHREFGDSKFGSVGRPSGDNSIRIVDPQDKQRLLPPGKVGIVEVKVPILGDDFISTTDLGVLDEDGFLFHRGRADGVIVRGGFKILPSLVEKILNAHPGIAASCIIGIAEPRLGQVPVAVLEMASGVPPATSAELEAHLRANLPSTNIPVAFHILPELPRTTSLKVDIGAVKAIAEKLAEEKVV